MAKKKSAVEEAKAEMRRLLTDPGEETRDKPSPIGVGRDYVAPGRGLDQWSVTERFGVRPRYFPGSERTEVAKLSPEDRAEIQIRLKQIGLIGPKTKVQLSVWDDTSASAFREVLAWANSVGSDWRSALDEMEMSGFSMGELGGEEAAPLPTNSLDVQAMGRTTSREVLGRGLTDTEKSKFEGAFRGMEGQYNSGTAGQDAPSGEGMGLWAEQQVRALDPVRADSRSAVKVAGVISRMLGGATAFEGA